MVTNTVPVKGSLRSKLFIANKHDNPWKHLCRPMANPWKFAIVPRVTSCGQTRGEGSTFLLNINHSDRCVLNLFSFEKKRNNFELQPLGFDINILTLQQLNVHWLSVSAWNRLSPQTLQLLFSYKQTNKKTHLLPKIIMRSTFKFISWFKAKMVVLSCYQAQQPLSEGDQMCNEHKVYSWVKNLTELPRSKK